METYEDSERKYGKANKKTIKKLEKQIMKYIGGSDENTIESILNDSAMYAAHNPKYADHISSLIDNNFGEAYRLNYYLNVIQERCESPESKRRAMEKERRIKPYPRKGRDRKIGGLRFA